MVQNDKLKGTVEYLKDEFKDMCEVEFCVECNAVAQGYVRHWNAG